MTRALLTVMGTVMRQGFCLESGQQFCREFKGASMEQSGGQSKKRQCALTSLKAHPSVSWGRGMSCQ